MNIRFFIFCLCISGGLYAQPFFDLIRFNVNIIPIEKSQYFEQRLQINFPINPDGKHKIILGFEGRKASFNLDNENANTFAPDALDLSPITNPLYDYSFYLACNYKINEKWESYLRLTPRWRYQGENNSDDSFQPGFLSISSYKKSNRLQYKFGVYYNKEEFGNFIIPLLGVDYHISDRWRLYLIAPSYSRIQYSLVPKKWFTGLAHFSPISSYKGPFQESDYVRNDQILIYGFLERDFMKNSSLILQMGYTAKHKFTTYNVNDPFNSGLQTYEAFYSNTFYASLGVAIRFRK